MSSIFFTNFPSQGGSLFPTLSAAYISSLCALPCPNTSIPFAGSTEDGELSLRRRARPYIFVQLFVLVNLVGQLHAAPIDEGVAVWRRSPAPPAPTFISPVRPAGSQPRPDPSGPAGLAAHRADEQRYAKAQQKLPKELSLVHKGIDVLYPQNPGDSGQVMHNKDGTFPPGQKKPKLVDTPPDRVKTVEARPDGKHPRT